MILDGPDPGNLGGNEEAEAILDTTWAGAIARNAAVKFVLSASTNTTDGIILSELYIIDNNVGDVMTESFGGCEAATTTTEAAGFEALAEEAAAQGMTYVVSTGDTGAAGCDNLGETQAAGPVSVSVLASTPFTVAVGGTMFNENGHNSTYWNSDQFVVACFRQIVHPGKRVERNLYHSMFRAERSTVGRWRRGQRVLQQALMADWRRRNSERQQTRYP